MSKQVTLENIPLLNVCLKHLLVNMERNRTGWTGEIEIVLRIIEQVAVKNGIADFADMLTVSVKESLVTGTVPVNGHEKS